MSEGILNNRNGWKSLLAQTFVKAGPWSVLLVIVLGAVWYEVDKWMGAYVNAQERYIIQSTENIVTLQRATNLLTETVIRNTDRLGVLSDNVKINQEYLQTTANEMKNANELMHDAPERSKRTIAVLERIERVLTTIEKKGGT